MVTRVRRRRADDLSEQSRQQRRQQRQQRDREQQVRVHRPSALERVEFFDVDAAPLAEQHHQDREPMADSAAATVSTKNTKIWPSMSPR
jgi:hypothetical protein